MRKLIIILPFLLGVSVLSAALRSDHEYPLRINPSNFRYFIDSSGKTVILAGSHTWMRRRENGRYFSDGWDIEKFNRYLDFLEYWNHNYIRLWMWEHQGDVDIWIKTTDGRYDLSKLNQEYFDRIFSFVKAAESRGIYVGVMLFQGWSGCCEASKADWPFHPMNKANNINRINGDPGEIGYGNKVHSIDNMQLVSYQEAYVAKMIETLNSFNNIIWEIGNETIRSSIPWKAHITGFIKGYEKLMPKKHLVLDGTGNGVGNNSITLTGCDIFSPCVVKTWASPDELYIANPPPPDENTGKPIVLDNDHLGNHFLRHPALLQRQWTWKSFTRGNQPIHMDCYDTHWDGSDATPDHPIKGVATNPHYDPQRKCLGDILRYAEKSNIVNMSPVTDSLICSTTFCLADPGMEYIVYQPQMDKKITLDLPKGEYFMEIFDTTDSSVNETTIIWPGGIRSFNQPEHCSGDWVLYIKKRNHPSNNNLRYD